MKAVYPMKVLHPLLLLAGLAVLACSGDDGPSQPNGDANTVVVSNNLFAPSTLTVPAGTVVTWQWSSGGVAHTVTFDDGADSGIKSSGTFPRTFSVAGTFPYHCTLHEGMAGTVTVTAGTTGGNDTGGGGGGTGGGGGYP